MKLVDTCIWIEALLGSATGKKYLAVLADAQHLMVPTLVQYELRRWALRELDEGQADQIQVATHAAQVVVLDEVVALYAAELASRYRLHALDAMIYATALVHKAELVTCDAHFEGLPNVAYLPKVGVS